MSVTSALQRESDRLAALERFARLIAGAETATAGLTAWCGGPPSTVIHSREETVALPDEAALLGQPRAIAVLRRSITHRWRGEVLCDARSTVWLDSPVLPVACVEQLRHGGQSLADVLRPMGLYRHTTGVNRLFDYRLPVGHDDHDRPVLLVTAALHVSGERVALATETYLEPVLFSGR
jgi:hypothetical protein